MRRIALHLRHYCPFSSKSEALYSFLEPTLFSVKKPSPTQPVASSNLASSPQGRPETLTLELKSTLETTLHKSIITNETDEAWKSFKALTSYSAFPSKSLTNSLITHLSSLNENHNLKRAFASTIYVIEKDPDLIDFGTVVTLLNSIKCANTSAPAFALIKSMFKNRFFVPFELWGNVLVDISSKCGHLGSFLRIFEESCRIAVEEKLESMKPNLAACNAALEGCCRSLESVMEAEKVLETMSVLGIKPDESTFGSLAYLYAIKGLEAKIAELEILMSGFGLSNKTAFYSNLICGYVKVDNLDSVLKTVLRCLREGDGSGLSFADEIYCEMVKGFLKSGNVKELSGLIINSQKLETNDLSRVERSVGYGIVNACISLGYSDKAHSVLDEMNIQGGSAGLGVYLPILKAYGKEHRTAEATQLVMDISGSGLQLDLDTYDMLIESSMSNQDFQSAFTLFRDMRETRVQNLKGSYLTIMTGLMENQRPELMAAFLDEVVEDPRIEVGTHDWNSIIHAFCKSGRLEDARRTFRRMTFLQFEPNDQTYLSLISGYVTGEKYFNVLMLWNEVKRKISPEKGKGIKFDHSLVDAFLYAMVKGGFFDAVMQVVDKSQELKIFVDKWRYKQAFMENHKKLKVNKLRKKNLRKMEALVAFKNWVGLNA